MIEKSIDYEKTAKFEELSEEGIEFFSYAAETLKDFGFYPEKSIAQVAVIVFKQRREAFLRGVKFNGLAYEEYRGADADAV